MGKKRKVTVEKIIPWYSYIKFAKTGFPAAACTGDVPGSASAAWHPACTMNLGPPLSQGNRLWFPKTGSTKAVGQFLAPRLQAAVNGVRAEEVLSLGSGNSQDAWLGACHDNHSVQHLPAALQRDSCLETQ